MTNSSDAIPPTMRAARFAEFGSPDRVLHLEDVAVPVPAGDDEVLVAVRAAAINPSDVKNVEGSMSHYTTLPRIPGRDFAGVIVAGPAAAIGREVWGTGGDLGFIRDGTHASYVRLPAAAAPPKPSSLSFAEAAAVGVSYVTAAAALLDRAVLAPGESLLIVGGRGAVGTAAAQIARWRGVGPLIVTTRTGEPESGGLEDAVIRLPREDIAAKMRELTGGRGADVILNVVGGSTFAPSTQALANGGRMVCISVTGDRHVTFDLLDFYRRDLRVIGLNTLFLDAVHCARYLESLTAGFDAGILKLREGPTEIALALAPVAYLQVRDGYRHKVVLTMDGHAAEPAVPEPIDLE